MTEEGSVQKRTAVRKQKRSTLSIEQLLYDRKRNVRFHDSVDFLGILYGKLFYSLDHGEFWRGDVEFPENFWYHEYWTVVDQHDGCNEFMIMARIILPLPGAALSSLTIFSFRWQWNGYLPWSFSLCSCRSI